jgi:hypothetical protein
MTAAELALGQYVIVAYGKRGKQVAQVTEIRAWRVAIRKFRANSGTWTKPLLCEPRSISRAATAKEAAKARQVP